MGVGADLGDPSNGCSGLDGSGIMLLEDATEFGIDEEVVQSFLMVEGGNSKVVLNGWAWAVATMRHFDAASAQIPKLPCIPGSV